MVYVLGGEYCHEGIGLIRRRNILFTAITRSRGWVRLCGVGEPMNGLQAEWNQVVKNKFQLTFTVPTPEELEKMRKIHRDRTDDEVQKIEKSRKSLEEILELIEREELALEDLSPTTRRKLAKLLGGK